MNGQYREESIVNVKVQHCIRLVSELKALLQEGIIITSSMVSNGRVIPGAEHRSEFFERLNGLTP
jgi:hypothetical protein